MRPYRGELRYFWENSTGATSYAYLNEIGVCTIAGDGSTFGQNCGGCRGIVSRTADPIGRKGCKPPILGITK
jgi:hypothetical protein